MINPQRENGHIDINNENGEQFAKLHLSGNEWQILWVILRKTWGWNKKEDSISLTQFEELTGISRPSVKEAIDKLVGKKVLVVKKELYINVYSFNKLHNEWIVPKKVLVGFSVKDSRVFGKKLVGKKEHTIDNTKDTIQKTAPLKKQNTQTDDNQLSEKKVAKFNYTPSKFCNIRDTSVGCGVCGFCSLTACSHKDLYQLALKKEISFEDVKRSYDGLVLWIEGGRMKDKTTYRTLENWISRDITRGTIKQLNYMELEMMDLKYNTTLRSELKIIHDQLEKGITPWTHKNS